MQELIQNILGFIYGAIASIGLGFALALGIIFLMKNRRSPEVVKHKTDAIDKITLQEKDIAAFSNNDGVWCGQHNAHDIFISTQDRGIVIGPPGTGKTSFLITQLLKWIETKRSFVCLDIKPEIHKILEKRLKEADYNIHVYNPSLEKSEKYNPFNDLDSAESIGELAASLIPSPDPRNAVFYENARDFLDAIISHLHAQNKASLPNMRDFLKQFSSYKELFDALINSPDKDAAELANGLTLVGANERMLGSIFSTLRSNLRFLRKRPFTPTDIELNPKRRCHRF